MKYFLLFAFSLTFSHTTAKEHEEEATSIVIKKPGDIGEEEDKKLNMENGVIPIADDRGFTLQSQDGNFVFKPYMYLQTTLNFNFIKRNFFDFIK